MSKATKRTTEPALFEPDPLRLPALRMRQGRDRVLYAFAVDGKQVEEFATVSRIGRDGNRRIIGYQRPEVLSHIAEIRAYLESDNPMLPNAVVIAFDPTVRFVPLDTSKTRADAPAASGELVIPLPANSDARKPGWIVDGQQRLAAIREAAVTGFPVWVIGFVADGDAEQREQFILVNNTRPLPKGLVYELLPATEARLPTALGKRRFPISLLDRLNLDADSPLKGRVKTPTMPDGLVKDNSLIRMIENSLSDGALYRLRGRDGEAGDVEGMLRVLKAFWSAVAAVFPEAWGKKPKESRLLHGAGVVSMGFVMDAIADRGREAGLPTEELFRADLEAIRPVCRWTEGHWEFGPGFLRKWNEVQNTPKDIQVLANYLLVQYKQRVWIAAG
ncbi:MAG TPA: DGQHR domain-containing protein DpdB [Urbifossiella sp.]|jgi:DGQHR domain-containing protein|nr:DGQHR domain-containing protein DpdB [Urbifossiella sp.]